LTHLWSLSSPVTVFALDNAQGVDPYIAQTQPFRNYGGILERLGHVFKVNGSRSSAQISDSGVEMF
jgi:hypothetical protein